MNEKKNIDRLFQEKFKDFEAVPSDAVWNRLSESLPKKKKKRRVIALWWQIGGIAATIALLVAVGSFVFNPNDNSTISPTVVETEHIQNKESSNSHPKDQKKNEIEDNNTLEQLDFVNSKEKETSDKLLAPNKSKSNLTVSHSTEKEKLSQKQKTTIINKDNGSKVAIVNESPDKNSVTELKNKNEIKSEIKKTIEDNNSAVTENSLNKDSDTQDSNTTDSNIEEKSTIIKNNPEKESIIEAIAENTKDIDEKEKEDEQSRWSIVPNVAPVYFSSLGQGSSLDSQFNQNSKSSDINISYGIAGTYVISNKLKIRAGINRVNLSQTTSNVFAFTDGEFASRNIQNQLENISARGDLGSVTLMSANMFDKNTSPEVFSSKIAGNVDQRFGFIEVPLELEYSLLDNKFGLNLIGGFSTFFLNQNEIYADIDGNSTLIGEANNINSTSFSANFGLGLDYKLSKQWNINLEPQFKYQINTFSDTSGNFRPFFIGVYTGLSYKF